MSDIYEGYQMRLWLWDLMGNISKSFIRMTLPISFQLDNVTLLFTYVKIVERNHVVVRKLNLSAILFCGCFELIAVISTFMS